MSYQEYDCGNKNPKILCKTIQCLSCDKFRSKLPSISNYPKMPPVKPPKILFTHNDFIIWLKGFVKACSTGMTQEQIAILKNKLLEL